TADRRISYAQTLPQPHQSAPHPGLCRAHGHAFALRGLGRREPFMVHQQQAAALLFAETVETTAQPPELAADLGIALRTGIVRGERFLHRLLALMRAILRAAQEIEGLIAGDIDEPGHRRTAAFVVVSR